MNTLLPPSPPVAPVTPTLVASAAALPPPLVHVLVATFAVKGIDGSVSTKVVEVPHTQNPKADFAAAWHEIRTAFPAIPRDNIRRTAGSVKSRPGAGLPVIPLPSGFTIRQLFVDGTDTESARTVGTVIFDGARRDVVLRHIRAKSVFSLTLSQPGQGAINFSEQVTVMRLAAELPEILAGMLGDAGTELTLFFEKKI